MHSPGGVPRTGRGTSVPATTIELMFELDQDAVVAAATAGTSPARRSVVARPSMIAVLPTPGSPISTGLFFLRRARTSIVVSISRARPITGSRLAVASQFREVARKFIEVGRVRGRLDPTLLGPLAHNLRDLLAQRLRRQAELAKDVGGQAIAFFGESDQQVFRADIGMAQLVRGDEGAVQRILQTRADADLAILFVFAARGLFVDLAAQVVHVDLELLQQRPDHIAVTQREEQMFGIDLGAAEFPCFLRGLLQELVALFAKTIGDARPALAAPTATIYGNALTFAFVADTPVHPAKRAVTEEFVEERSAAEERFQRRGTTAAAGVRGLR